MTSGDEELGATDNGSQSPRRVRGLRQRRPQRSCDTCRQRKSDGANMTDGHCSNCLSFGSACTYLQPALKRGPKNMTMEELKKENASLKANLRAISLCPVCSQPFQSLPAQGDGNPKSFPATQEGTPESVTAPSDSKEPPDEQDFLDDDLVSRFQCMKQKFDGRPPSRVERRPLFWEILPWEKEAYDIQPFYIYPPSDLIDSLLDLYFICIHPTIPIFHRPSFEQSVAEGLHLTDMDFGGTLLAVLAVTSRYSTDPRVFVDGDKSLSSGWKFAKQIKILRKRAEPSIHEVQTYFFLTLFSLGSSMPQLSWLYLGLGIRFLQQRGEHRRKPKSHEANAEDEMWKRVFWSFVFLERTVCLFLGRPMGLHVEEYDLELPLQVDDEYWGIGFIQPLGKPSQLSYFVYQLRLCEILADAMRRLYGSKKSKILLGWDGPDWEHRAVAELDSAMNDFFDSIPSIAHTFHPVRWDPENPPQGTFFDQSAVLYMSYNHVLIAIHRPNMHRGKVSEQGAPSLFICARAARAILRTADIWLSKLQRVPLPYVVNPVFISGVILVLYMMGTKRALGVPIEKNKDAIQIATALDILKFAESRLQPMGRLWELLRELWSLDGPLPSKYRPSYASDSVDVDVGAPPAASEPVSAVPMIQYHAQLASDQSLFDAWNTAPSSDPPEQSPVLKPGMSIEQLLADAGPVDTMDTIFDDELMSMWMATPTVVANIADWNAYIGNRNLEESGSAAF
ncbi:fungal-specific transcription factor domain-containing protein [Mycena olivaceomarginata]|nr:fungal-specific transcription factor domain-containing protein [Mycena olivaceomarginata]